MFTKILIANRGEIACRVIKTARRLGIRTVAVYSDADANALHVKMADEAVHIGAAPSSESYLCGDKVIAAALKTGAQAVHPGYGFLSENAQFCQACERANLVFIGPPVGAIEAMGSKSAAKTIMGDAGVPLVPGYHGQDQNPERLKQAADDMGYPVLLKAVAGGGGKGMRQVWSEQEFEDALAAAKREAIAGFANGDMLVEKYLTQPRHVEVQVFCDQHGNGVHLFERDCSVQRRHQKVIEEAPAPGVNDALRAEMGAAALRAAQAINYVGAGTVEFLLNNDGSFFFMEMNTRLQVEHPVTEMITGQDLVEWQLRVAAGETLPCTQADLSIHGHAFEARIYAEDPATDFLPATGTLNYLQPPQQSAHVRVDTGVEQGDAVSIYYDPMIAKLIVWDENRDQALNRLCAALHGYHVAGVTTNTAFLATLAAHPAFREAQLETGFIETHEASLFDDSQVVPAAHIALAASLQALWRLQKKDSYNRSLEANSPWHADDEWRMSSLANRTEEFSIAGSAFSVPVHRTQVDKTQYSSQTNYFTLTVDDRPVLTEARMDKDSMHINIDGQSLTAKFHVNDHEFTVFMHDTRFTVSSHLPDLGIAATETGSGFRAPMNGTVVSVIAEIGAEVAAGDALMIIEAMKMEHTIRAAQAGKVTEVFFAAGDLVDGGAELLSFDVNA